MWEGVVEFPPKIGSFKIIGEENYGASRFNEEKHGMARVSKREQECCLHDGANFVEAGALLNLLRLHAVTFGTRMDDLVAVAGERVALVIVVGEEAVRVTEVGQLRAWPAHQIPPPGLAGAEGV